jgi:hypothetical protein
VSVLPELYALRSIEQFPASALSLVRRVVGGDKGDYTEVDVRSGDFRVFVDPEPPQLRDLGAARAAYMHQHPVLAHFFNGGAPNARLISDFCTRREFHRLGLYGEFFGQLGVEDQLTVVVSPLSSGCGIGVSIDRDRRNFDDRDRRLMDALQPHLTVARDNAVRFSHALSRRTRSDEPPDAAALERVTDRRADRARPRHQHWHGTQARRAHPAAAGPVNPDGRRCLVHHCKHRPGSLTVDSIPPGTGHGRRPSRRGAADDFRRLRRCRARRITPLFERAPEAAMVGQSSLYADLRIDRNDRVPKTPGSLEAGGRVVQRLRLSPL